MIITPDDIRGLTLWRPWPWAFTHADKRVENRPKPPPRHMVGGWLALHSGLKFDNDACEAMQGGEYGEAARGCPSSTVYHPESVITCVVHIEGWHLVRPVRSGASQMVRVYDGHIEHDPWAFGPVVIRTPRVLALPSPVPCKGAQGYWRLPPNVFEAVRSQLME